MMIFDFYRKRKIKSWTKMFGMVWFSGISTILGYLMPNPAYTYIRFSVFDSISSSSCCAISTDIPGRLSPHLPIVHWFRQILRATSRIGTELLYVGSNWTSCLCSSMCRGPDTWDTAREVGGSSWVMYNSPASHTPYVGLKFAIVGWN